MPGRGWYTGCMGFFYGRRTTGLLRLAVMMLSMSFLTACGGGGGGGGGTARVTLETPPSPLIDPGETQRVMMLVTGSEPDIPPSQEDIENRGESVAGMSDALLFSEIAAEGGSESRIITCAPGMPMCEAMIDGGTGIDPVTESQAPGDINGPVLFNGGGNLAGYNDSYSFFTVDGGTENNLIPLVQVSAAGRDSRGVRYEHQGYGGWLANSIFIVQQNAVVGSNMFSTFSAYSFGKANTNNPNATATWNGVMVGTEKVAGDIIQGDARIKFDMNTPSSVAVDFMNIKNFSNNGDAKSRDMNWNSVPLTSGTFTSEAEMTGFISGRFYGDKHEEVGGIFDRGSIIGAFGGVKR